MSVFGCHFPWHLLCRGLAVAQLYHEKRPAPGHHHVEDNIRRARMSVSDTHRKGLTYRLYRGQTRIGKPCYSFGRRAKRKNRWMPPHR